MKERLAPPTINPNTLVSIGLWVALGTLARLVYGLVVMPWLGAPDQMAWGLLLMESHVSMRLDQLVLWPHEGGSLFVSLLAWPFVGLNLPMPPLSLSGLLLDAGIRLVQIGVVFRLFGNRAGTWFAIWTVFAVPSLVAWGTTNYGMHALSSGWPFILLWAWQGVSVTDGRRIGVLALVCGLSLSWSYDALPFVCAVGLLWAAQCINLRTVKPFAIWLVILVASLLPHALLRIIPDYGFHLDQGSQLGIRGVSFGFVGVTETMSRVLGTVVEAVPGATLLPGFGISGGDVAVRVLWTIVVLIGVGALVRAWWTQARQESRRLVDLSVMPLTMVGTFIVIYAISPFFEAAMRTVSLATYRHLATVLPLIGCVTVLGLLQLKRSGRVLLVAFILLGGVGTIARTRPSLRPVPNIDVAGWILGRKFGHDPERLARIVNLAPADHRDRLAHGMVWGLTATSLNHVVDSADARVQQLVIALGALPPVLLDHAASGVAQAFSPEVTPRLAGDLLPIVIQAIDARVP